MMNDVIQIQISEAEESVSISVQEGSDSIGIEVSESNEQINLEVRDMVVAGTVPTSIENRIAELENSNDGLIDGIDFLSHYRLKRDN